MRGRRAPQFLPEQLRHLQQGVPRVGASRSAQGLLLRGVVVAVYRPDDRPARTDAVEAANTAITCDVVILDPRYRCIFRDVPVVTQSQGLNDYETWVPRPATVAINGATLNLDGKGVPGLTTDLSSVDGDHVLIAFMANDLQRPVILGALPHPGSKRRPSGLGTKYKWSRWVRGIRVGVKDDGNVEIDLSEASNGTILPTGDEVPTATAGNVVVTVSATGSIVVTDGGTPEGVILGESFLTDLQLGLTEVATFLNGFGFVTPNLASLLSQISTALATVGAQGGAPYLSSNVKVD